MWTLGTPALEIVTRAALIYLALLARLRLFGKREIGQFTLFDLALVLLAANALQPAITGPDQGAVMAFLRCGGGIAAGVSDSRRCLPDRSPRC